MKNKSILILAILFVSIFAISAASANENLTDDIASVEDTQVNLTDGNANTGTFIELSNLIDSKDAGDTLDLEKSYQGSYYIEINKEITIDGHGNSLDGNSHDSILYINSASVTLKNIKFINGKYDSFGGAIYVSPQSNLTLINSSFINCYAECGGAVYLAGNSNLQVTDCNFTNNVANVLGGAIAAWSNCDVSLTRTNFTNNTATHESGGAVFCLFSNLNADYIAVNDCVSQYGGAITLLSSNAAVTHSTFRKNRAAYDGGAIFSMHETLTLNDNVFTENSAKRASAVYSSLNDLTIANNRFTGNLDLNVAVIYAMNATDKPIGENIFTDNAGVNVLYAQNDNLTLTATDYYSFQYKYDDYTELPSHYSLVEHDFVTSVKNQGQDGNCWAFATMGALESCILKAGGPVFDLSEANLKNLMAYFSDYGHMILTNDGGNYKMASGYLASWLGPINDADDLYYENDFISPLLKSILHVQNILYIKRTDYMDNDAIKNAIYKYGAVSSGIYYDGEFFDNQHNSYYYNGDDDGNHAVCIVGWDDTYSRYNFKNTPSGDGAWIARNSWGPTWANNGYFYVSYYDTKLAEINTIDSYTFILNDTVSFNRIYQYEIQSTSFDTINVNSINYKNIFTVEGNEYLSAVSTYFGDVCDYTVSVYINDDANPVTIKNGKSDLGYYTINLDNKIYLNKDDNVTVVFNCFNFKGGNATVPLSYQENSVNLFLKPGRSYYGYDDLWADLYDSGSVACIKIFTTFSNDNKINPYLNLNCEGDYQDNSFLITFTLPNDATGFININTSNNQYRINLSETRSIKLYDLTPDNNTLSIEYLGDEVYLGKTLSYVVDIQISQTGTCEELQDKINHHTGVLDLHKNYVFDSSMSEGILISNAITIDGHGHSISGAGIARIFKIYSENVILKNIIFRDAYCDEYGGAIQVASSKCQIINCSFINNIALEIGGAIYWYGENGVLNDSYFENNSAHFAGAVFLSSNNLISNSTFKDNHGSGAAVYIYGNNNEITQSTFTGNSKSLTSVINVNGNDNNIHNSSFIKNNANYILFIKGDNTKVSDSSFMNSTVNKTAVYIDADNVIFRNCNFINLISTHDSAAFLIWGENCLIDLSIFANNLGNHSGGAISLVGDNCNVTNSRFINNSVQGKLNGGAIYLYGNYTTISNTVFINNSAFWGGAISVNSNNNTVSDCLFETNTADYGGAVYWQNDDGVLSNSIFIYNSANYGRSVFWTGENGSLINSTFNNTAGSYQIYWYNDNTGNISGCKFQGSTSGNVLKGGSTFTKHTIDLTSKEYSVDYNSPDGVSVKFTIVNGAPINSPLTFTISGKNYNIYLENDTAVILNPISGLKPGKVTASVRYDGDDNYDPFSTGFTITITKTKSQMTLESTSAVLNQPMTLTANVADSSNYPVNTGSVTFFNGQTSIGSANVENGIATLTYTPTGSGEISITAIFSSDDYLSSNNTLKVFVDAAEVTVVENQGTVGVSTELIADVTALYSDITDGSVTFYVNGAIAGKSNLNNGRASVDYIPSTAGTLTIRAIYENTKFASVEGSARLTVSKAKSQLTIDDLKPTVGVSSQISAHVKDNDLAINDGSVSFYEDGTLIGTASVSNGVANLAYAPKTSGRHNISAVFSSNNYEMSGDSVIVNVDKAGVTLNIKDISSIYCLDTVVFTVTVNSGNNPVGEGSVKFYIGNSLIGSDNVNNGVGTFSYTAMSVGSFDLSVVFDQTANYLTSSSTKTFTVNSIPTILVGNPVTSVYNVDDALIVTLTDGNGKPLAGETLSVDFNGVVSFVTDSNGQIRLSTIGLAPNNYAVTVTYSGDANHAGSTVTTEVSVLKATPKLTAGKKTFKRTVKTKKYAVSLKTHQNAALGKVKLTLKVNGKKFSAKTNSRGKATFKIKKLSKKGTFKAVITYNGNAFYNKLTKTVKITVK